MTKIKIAELELDDTKLLKSTQRLGKTIDELKAKQKTLNKSTDEGRKEFIKNEATLKNLSTAYRSNIKVMADRVKVTKDAESRTELLKEALEGEVKTIEEARAQNKILNKLRNTANTTTAEGVEEIEKLNKKLDENNELIKENADGYLKLKLNIGNYSEGIKEAFNDLNIFNGGLTGFITRSKEAGGTGNLVKSSLGGMAQGFLGVTKASLAFIATPIGAILALLVGAFTLVKNAMNRSEEATNKITKIFSIFSGIVNKLLKYLEPLGEFLIDGLVAGFELVGQFAEHTLGILASALEFLGFDSAAESVRSFTSEMKEAAQAAAKLADAEARLEKAQRRAQLIQLQFQKDAEKLRQLRDDEGRTISQRLKDNDELGKLLQKQLAEELKIAQLALEVANLRIESEGKTKENLDEQFEALTRIADIEERITGQQSEQLTNRNALLKEAADKRREIAEQAIEEMEQELELMKEQNRFTAKTEKEKVDLLDKFSKEEQKILKEKLENNLISQTEYNTEVLKLENDLIEARKELEEKELERIQEFENQKQALEEDIRLRRAASDIERAELQAQLDFEKQVAELEALQLREEEKTQLLALLEEQRGLILSEIRGAYLQEQLDKIIETNSQITASEQTTANLRAGIAQTLTRTLQGLLGDSLGARLAGIAIEGFMQAGLVKMDAAAASARVAASIATANAKAVSASPLTGGMPFVGANLKQQAIMQAGIVAKSTQAISRILASSALKGVGAIANKLKFGDGGIMEVGGKRHSAGGTKFYGDDGTVFEAERGEGIGILSRNAYEGFLNFNNSFPSGSSGNGKFEGGGIITQAVRPPVSNQDFEALQEAISQMQISVAVTDIRREADRLVEVESIANG